jgi:putative membrane protein
MFKRLLLVSALTATAMTAAGCHKTGSNASQDAAKPSDSAPVNAVQDVAATGVGAVSAPVAAMTTDAYVTAAAIADMYEIQAAKIASERTKRADIKAFAKAMIKDHTATSDALKKALKDGSITAALPTALDDRRQGMINNLKAAGDADFDGAYLHQQLAAHIEALELQRTFAAKTDVAPLKTAAQGAIPKIEMHLGMIRKDGGDLLKDAMPAGNDTTPASGATH